MDSPDRYDASNGGRPGWDQTPGAGFDQEPAPQGLSALGITPSWAETSELAETEAGLGETALAEAGLEADAEPGERPGLVRRRWRAFRAWRRTRPYWGGLQLVIGGAEIALTQRIPIKVIVHLGAQGLLGQAVPVIMIICGLLLWVTPDQRLFYGIIGFLASGASWITSNLGGFVIGLVFGIIGASMAIAWTPLDAVPSRSNSRRRARRRHVAP
jgi:hypothetical protein